MFQHDSQGTVVNGQRHARPRVACLAWGTLALALNLSVAATWAVEPPSLSAGVAAVEITPPVEMINWVNGKPYGEVRDPLWVRALVLSDGQNRVALLALDLVETREALSAMVRARITESSGIPGDHVLMNASHSHSAPFVPTGEEPLVVVEQKLLLPETDTPVFRAWAAELVTRCVAAVTQADAARRAATLGIARAWVGEALFNRRPIAQDGMVQTTLLPASPFALPEGQRFGPMDPTLTWLSLHDGQGQPLAAAFQLSAHAVAIYGEYRGLSADWPGEVTRKLKASLGVESLFLQGCGGDIVPRRRGVVATEAMGALIAERALAAEANWHALPPARLRAARVDVDLPYSASAARETGRRAKRSEVQLVTYGSLAIVAIPGEPLTRIGQEIQERSPFPHTVVLGYSNGSGVEYVGVPGEKAKGGYEMGEWGLGDDQCGALLIDAAASLLQRAE